MVARLHQAYLDYFYLDGLKYTVYQFKDDNRHEGDLAPDKAKNWSVGTDYYLIRQSGTVKTHSKQAR